MSENRRVYIYSEGTEITDELAKKGVYLEQNAVTSLPVPFREVKQKQEVILLRQANRLLERAKDCRIAKTLCKTYNELS